MNSHPCVCTRQPEIISAARIERLALQRVGVMKCSPNVAKCSLGEERDGFLLTSLSRHTDSLAFQFLLVPFQASKSPVGVLGALRAGEAPGQRCPSCTRDIGVFTSQGSCFPAGIRAALACFCLGKAAAAEVTPCCLSSWSSAGHCRDFPSSGGGLSNVLVLIKC